MPLTAAAFAAGELSSSRVDLLVRANRPAVSGLFARDEEMLLSMIDDLGFADSTRAVDYWSQCADESGANDRGKRQLNQRSANASKTFEGSIELRALFAPVDGEIYLNELERLDDILFNADWAEAKAIHGDDVRVEHLARTPSQRRCDALVLMAQRSAASTGSTPNPLISVIVDFKTFGRICETASGTIIAPRQVIPLLGEAEVERIVFDGPSRIIDVGYARSFKGALRRAIQVRDRHCQDPSGCEEPASKCDVDHTFAFSRGGITDQTNGRALCGFHNRAKGSGPP